LLDATVKRVSIVSTTTSCTFTFNVDSACLFILLHAVSPSLNPHRVHKTAKGMPPSLATVKAEIKTWERAFRAKHDRNPTRDDIKARKDIGTFLL
jgi:hypothetical protein